VPIYEYRCSSCAFQKEYLRKVSDPLLSVCPECGNETFGKMLTAAGFQLKGGGWYATDFKHSGSGPAAKGTGKNGSVDKSGGTTAEAKTAESKTEPTGGSKSEGKSDSKTPAPPAAAPAASASAAKAE
jgi:putative FmdB family regulatory protein